MNNDQRMEIEQRLSVLNDNLAEISLRSEALHEKLKVRRNNMQAPTETDHLYTRLFTIQRIIVEEFPQYQTKLHDVIVIPGIAGGGEIGPGGVKFPNYDEGGTLNKDPHSRNYHS